jgi:hypothetical protein
MRAAPPVSVRCDSGVPWRLVQSGLMALASAVAVDWVLAHAAASPAPALGVLAGVGALAWRLTATQHFRLAWDGDCWTVDGVPGRLDVMMDLGGWLLLRLRPTAAGHSRWAAVTAREAGPALHGLRVAAYSHATEQDLPALATKLAAD